MKGNLKILIFLFSIILNVVFVGTYAAYKFQIIPGERKDDNLMKPLFLELDLTAQQLTKFKSERDEFHPHLQALEQARHGLDAAMAKLDARSDKELMASDLRCTLEAFGQIAGRIDNERILDELFATFCIGK